MPTSGLDNATGTNAAGTRFDRVHPGAGLHADILKIREKGPLHVLHDVLTNSALLLGHTAPGDRPADVLAFTANAADSAHVTYPKRIITRYPSGAVAGAQRNGPLLDPYEPDRARQARLVGWPGLEPGPHGLKGRCSAD